MHRIYKYRLWIAAGLLLLVLLAALPKLSTLWVADIVSYTPETPLLAALVLAAIYCCKSFVMVIPVVALYISAGVLFPTGWAIGLTYICLFCEISIGYWMGKKLGRDKVGELMDRNPNVKRFLHFQQRNRQTTCFISRMVPIPLDLFSLFAGASDMGYGSYVVFSLLGLTPGMVPWVIAGNAIENPLSREFLVPFAVSIAIAVLVFLLLRYMEKKTTTTND